MSKSSRKKPKRLLKYDLLGDATSPKQKRQRHSLLDDEDFSFDSPADPNEWDKLYLGLPSEFDDLDPDDEYIKASKADKDKTPKRRSLLDDDYEEDFSTIGQTAPPIPSSLPDPSPSSVLRVTAHPVSPTTTDEDDEAKYLALRLAEDFAKRKNVILIDGAPYVYNGKFYSLLKENEAEQMFFANYRKELAQTSTVTVLRNAATLLKFCVRKVYDEFPVNSHIIVFTNGTLEINTGHFRKNSPDDLATSALAINYDPSRKKMPWTKHFLETIADGDDDLYDLMLQVIGYILCNDVKAKSFFYLEGVGDAGKSRFCDLIASFFPVSGANKVARIALQDLGNKYALVNLVNVKLNISEDLPDSPLTPTTVSRIKLISDSNRLEAEGKYIQPFSFRPLCKLLFASNHPLRLKEHDAAFVNRVVYIPFLHPIPREKQDKYILEKMQSELPALFNHAFKAYQRLVANGYTWAGSGRFKPNIFTVSSGISIDKELVLKRFVEECCEFHNDFTTATADLQAAYIQFCRKHTYLPIQGDRFSRELSAVLPDTVSRVKIGNQKRGFSGVRLKAPMRSPEFDGTDDILEYSG